MVCQEGTDRGDQINIYVMWRYLGMISDGLRNCIFCRFLILIESGEITDTARSFGVAQLIGNEICKSFDNTTFECRFVK